MKYVRICLFAFLGTSLLFSGFVSAQQPWSRVLSQSRAINWSQAGLPATLPDGETTANPWTPPVRTQCGSTLNPSGGDDTSAIQSAYNTCASGHYLLLGPGTFNVSSNLWFYKNSEVTLRGSGPQSTTVRLTGNAMFGMGGAGGGGNCNWTSGYSAGSSSLGLTSCSSAPTVGQVISLNQCDNGYSGAGCTTGSSVDDGGLYVCGYNDACQRAGEGSGPQSSQYQIVRVTGVSGSGGSYTVTVTPSLYMPNWQSGRSPVASWNGITTTGVGIEDMTIQAVSGASGQALVYFNLAYASWVKGVRFLGFSNPYPQLYIAQTHNCLFSNNYFYRQLPISSGYGPAIQQGGGSDNLTMNNIMDGDFGWEGTGSMEGDVVAYNFIHDAFTFDTNDFMEHNAGSAFVLYESNQAATDQDDDTHGTHNLSTWFRNYFLGSYAPYQGAPHPYGIVLNAYARFENVIGNSIGNTSANNSVSSLLNTYLDTTGSGFNFVYGMGYGGHIDPLVQATSLRWGNYDTVRKQSSWCGLGSETGCGGVSEIPTTLSGAAAPFGNPIPASHALPPSFFLPVSSPYSSGGTGLSWWRVCTAWTSFPSTCSANQTQPFPAIGPDVSGGPYNAGTAYDIPAVVAFNNLPIDTANQGSYAIASSSWSNGTETLTFNSGVLPPTTHLMGGFQISGSPCATSGAGTPTGAEAIMTNSSTTTVTYALASNPGSCAGGTMKFPDVRQFDERVYQADAGQVGSSTPPAAPSGLVGSVTVQ